MYSWFTIINGFCYFTNRKSITFIFFYCYYWFNSQILIHCANSFLFLIIELTQFNFYISVLFNFTIQVTNNLNNPSIKSLLLIDEFNNKIGDAILIIDLEKKEAILESIFIEEKYRKQQYGSLLIYKIFEICHSNNIENLILLSDPTNVTVGEFYEKLGFTYAWNKKTLFYDYEINIPHAIFNKRNFYWFW
ncbi:GNAT family N-acetyltransferase [Spiroplasma endosymbiont of Amphimallon solstitiale]|uniref:GNAT family N-acetyltransferase n=1 Tax=Spiroplasma endosymbiont of Amphimallon solstitiale TaxID=3066288 RepID=UPI003CC7A469